MGVTEAAEDAGGAHEPLPAFQEGVSSFIRDAHKSVYRADEGLGLKLGV